MYKYLVNCMIELERKKNYSNVLMCMETQNDIKMPNSQYYDKCRAFC